jgi:hypothetical protein
MDLSDDAVFFSDFADRAIWTPSAGGPAQPGAVIVNAPDTLLLNDMIVSTETTFTYPLGQWPGLGEGETVIVTFKAGSQAYLLRTGPQAIDDGRLLRVEVVKA